jgi:hypothetical protein
VTYFILLASPQSVNLVRFSLQFFTEKSFVSLSKKENLNKHNATAKKIKNKSKSPFIFIIFILSKPVLGILNHNI